MSERHPRQATACGRGARSRRGGRNPEPARRPWRSRRPPRRPVRRRVSHPPGININATVPSQDRAGRPAHPETGPATGVWGQIRDQTAVVVADGGTYNQGIHGRPTALAYGAYVADVFLPMVIPYTPGTNALWDPPHAGWPRTRMACHAPPGVPASVLLPPDRAMPASFAGPAGSLSSSRSFCCKSRARLGELSWHMLGDVAASWPAGSLRDMRRNTCSRRAHP